MHSLQASYDLHPLAVEDAISADQLPKVDVYGDQLFVVARTPHLEGETIEYGETAIFVGHSHIISVRHGSTRAHTALREQLEKAPRLLMHGIDYLLHAILDYIVDGYRPLVEQLEEEGLEMEQHAIDSFLGREEVNRIFTLRRELIRFQRMLGPMGEVAHKLARQELPCIDAEARNYFRDVLDHVRRVQNMVDGLREGLTSVFEFSSLLEQQRTGAITRQLAAWAAILAVPTAIAGIYGMNFENMPELKSRLWLFHRRRDHRRDLRLALPRLPPGELALARCLTCRNPFGSRSPCESTGRQSHFAFRRQNAVSTRLHSALRTMGL